MPSKIKKRSEALIPGLPDDVAVHCLIRVPRMYHFNLRSVSAGWNTLLQSSHFFQARKNSGFVDHWLVLILMDLVQTGDFNYCIYDLTSKSMLCRAPLTPSHSTSNFKTAAVDTSLVVVESKTTSYKMVLENRTHVYDTVNNTWKRSAGLSVPRSNFAMASVDGTVYVAGGYNYCGEFEPTTEAYDLQRDEWRKVSNIPVKLDRVDGEIVFEGKVYVRGFSAESSECVILVYDPREDTWLVDTSGMNNMDHGEMVTTSNGIYNLSSTDCFYKFDQGTGGWRSLGPYMERKTSSGATLTTFNVHAQRAFGLGMEIFVVGGELGRSSHLIGDSGVTFHSLFLGSSWFRAGSIVSG